MSNKVYVDVLAEFSKDGLLIPKEITWEDGRKYEITRVKDKRRAASTRAGGVGERYTCVVDGKEIFLFYEDNNMWFMETLTEELRGVIFQNPLTDVWETADQYLSGNVREKLAIAATYAENHPEYAPNVQALTQVQPRELDASEIEVRIGATWIDPKYINDFMRDTFQTPEHLFRRDTIGTLKNRPRLQNP